MPTSSKGPAKAAARATRWLDKDEEAAWRAFHAVVIKLPWTLERQLQRDADLSLIEYYTLARLSEGTQHTQRMSVLAELTDASLSRLSHLVTRLEARGYVRREPDPDDGRFTNAIMTKAGYAKLVASAPAHVEAVRDLVIDVLSPAELRRLRDMSQRLLTQVEGG
jgi:DNA-binding MarR family transcriptional regulator